MEKTTKIDGQGNPIPDEEVIKGVLAGNRRLFEQIIRRYNQRLYRIGMSILGNDPEVDEAMQTTYINAYEHLSQFEHRAAFATWLTRIMLNQCYKIKRARNLLIVDSKNTDNLINMKTPENVMASKELRLVLENAIAQLPEKYRLVFVLREIEDLSIKETAEVAGIQESNVKVRLNRAKSMLRENLTGYMKDTIYNFHLSRCDKMVSYVMNYLQIE